MAHPVRSRGFPLNCLYYSTDNRSCQALFWTFFIVGSAPSIRAEVARHHPTACAALCLLFITRVMGRPFKHRYQRCDFIGLTAHCCDLPPTHLRREALFTPRVCGVFLPLCDFSIPQPLDFVKHFFYFFCPRLTAPSPRCGGVASVLPSSALFLPDARRCWSTFISRTTGLRAVEDFVIKDLPTLVGLASLTSSDFRALPCFPHLHLDYTTGFAVCQAFFLTFFVDSGSLTSSDVCPPLKWGVRSLIPRRAQGRLGLLNTAIGIGLFGGDPLEPL